MSGRCCRYCGLLAPVERKVHDQCRHDAYYAVALRRYRERGRLTLQSLNREWPDATARARRAIRRVQLERDLERLTAGAQT